MKYKEIKDLAADEIQKRVRELSEEQFNLKMKNSLGQVNDPLKIRNIRKDIARLKTALAQK